MSGGSFGYLHNSVRWGVTSEVFNRADMLEKMAEALEEHGAEAEAATVRRALALAGEGAALLEPMADLFKAMEWWCSADYTDEQWEEALADHRALPTNSSKED
mgnify:CR=1 FL=1